MILSSQFFGMYKFIRKYHHFNQLPWRLKCRLLYSRQGISMKELIEEILSASHEVRYVAIYHRGELHSRERAGLADASSSESDHYEELLVNPTLLTLTNQRGNIDCGGLEYLVIRYG